MTDHRAEAEWRPRALDYAHLIGRYVDADLPGELSWAGTVVAVRDIPVGGVELQLSDGLAFPIAPESWRRWHFRIQPEMCAATTLADRCPDPDAHRAEDAGTVAALRTRIDDLERDRKRSREHREARENVMTELRERVARRNAEIKGLRADLAEARAARPAGQVSDDEVLAVLARASEHSDDPHLADADAMRVVVEVLRESGYVVARPGEAARPAPIRPEVVAVVEAAQVYAAAWVQRSALDERVALLDAVRALPEDWRDGAAADPLRARIVAALHAATTVDDDQLVAIAEEVYRVALTSVQAPAAVPAVLDEAGIERAARALRGNAYLDGPSETVRSIALRDAREVVRAYLGDTDTGSED